MRRIKGLRRTTGGLRVEEGLRAEAPSEYSGPQHDPNQRGGAAEGGFWGVKEASPGVSGAQASKVLGGSGGVKPPTQDPGSGLRRISD